MRGIIEYGFAFVSPHEQTRRELPSPDFVKLNGIKAKAQSQGRQQSSAE